MRENAKAQPASPRGHGLLGSLKDALAAASREDGPAAPKAFGAPETAGTLAPQAPAAEAHGRSAPPPLPIEDMRHQQDSVVEREASMASEVAGKSASGEDKAGCGAVPSAEEAARSVRGSVTLKVQDRHVEMNEPPTTRVVRKPAESKAKDAPRTPGDAGTGREVTDEPRTQLVRGRQKLQRNDFTQDPVVGWLVVVGGPGLGAFRPIFEGNNTLGRAKTQRIAIDFGDDAISSEEQAYIRYDSTDRSFLFVPNLAKTNVVSVNDKRPTGAVELAHMDVITVGRTQLVFVPFCGADFDWAELAEVKD